jgi:hypothetical protein
VEDAEKHKAQSLSSGAWSFARKWHLRGKKSRRHDSRSKHHKITGEHTPVGIRPVLLIRGKKHTYLDAVQVVHSVI